MILIKDFQMFLKFSIENLVILISTIVFFLGLVSVTLSQRGILSILISIELMLLSINLNFAMFSILFDDLLGVLFSLSILSIAAGEAAIGFSLLSLYYKEKKTIDTIGLARMRG